jgi:hypothetical protein
MSEPGMLVLRWQLDAARAYTISKGRMPKDVHELREWLREFAEFETKRLDAAMKAYEDHMAVCNRPLLIQFSGEKP